MKKPSILIFAFLLTLLLASCGAAAEKHAGSGMISNSVGVSDLLEAAEKTVSIDPAPSETAASEAAPYDASVDPEPVYDEVIEETEETALLAPSAFAAHSAAVELTRYDDVEIDLTTMNSTMVYSEVYDMMVSPEDYVGKTVKMKGAFAVYEGEKRNYYACIIADATACCAQGVEFVLDGDFAWPGDYPMPDSEITVAGVFDIYYEDDFLYCQLIDAEMVF